MLMCQIIMHTPQLIKRVKTDFSQAVNQRQMRVWHLAGAISLSHHKRQFKDINSLLVCL